MAVTIQSAINHLSNEIHCIKLVIKSNQQGVLATWRSITMPSFPTGLDTSL